MEAKDRAASMAHRDVLGTAARWWLSLRRRWLAALAALVACILIAGGTGLAAILTRSSRQAIDDSPAATCVAPGTPPVAAAPGGSGRGSFELLDPGTFGSVAASSSNLYALQACGIEETSLRVLRIGGGGKVLAVSAGFPRAALLTSSLLLTGGSLYVGAARLDLSAPLSSGQYALTLYRLSAASLKLLGSEQLGRGYGLSLAATATAAATGGAGATVLVSTGRSLLAMRSGSLSARTLATLRNSISQHIAAGGLSPYVAVSLFTPAAPLAETGGRVELFDLVTDRLVAAVRLAAGAEVESMATGDNSLFIAVVSGSTSEVRRLALPSLTALPAHAGTASAMARGMPLTLEPVGLNRSGGVVWARELTGLVCLDISSGEALGPMVPTPAVSQVLVSGATTYAVSAAGIGVLAAPASCRRAG